MEVIIVIISWLLFGGAASYFAGQRGRDPFAWFFIGMLLGILGLLLLFLLPTVVPPEEKAVSEGNPLEKPKEIQEGHLSYFRLKEWYYLSSAREQVGPSPYSTLRDMWKLKKITDQTYVWSDGMENWKKISEIPELKEALE
jgi:hypothetical protein